jgi:aromatase
MPDTTFTLEDLMDLLSEKAGLPPESRTTDPDAHFSDIGLDSLAFLSMQTELHDRFDTRGQPRALHARRDRRDRLRCPVTGRLTKDPRPPHAWREPPDGAGPRCHIPPTAGGPSMSTVENPSRTVGHTDNSIFIDADIDHVWRMTNDLPSWPDLFTEYAEVEVLAQHGSTFRFRLKMHPDESGRVWSWVSERTLDESKHEVVARRVEPGPFEFMDIRWNYAPEGTGTRMRWVQDFRMRPEAPIDTAGMTERIDANSKVQMAVIKDKVEAAARRGEPAT